MMKNKARGKAEAKASKPLKHPPLSEVVFEINFPRLFAVENRIADYQQKVVQMYPESGDEFVLHLPPAVAFGKSPRPEGGVTPVRSFVFRNPGNSRVVRVSVVHFSLLVLDYLDFEDYKRALTAALTPAIEIFKLSRLERVGLRYVNKIPVPNGRISLGYEAYVQSPINAGVFSPHQLNSFLTEVSIDLDQKKQLTIRSGLLPAQPDASTRTYLLDLDCSSPASVLMSGRNLTKMLDDYHEAIESEFKRVMTQKYWAHMADGSPM